MKKLLLSLGSVAAVAAPIAAVVACGNNDSVKTFGHTYGKQEATGFVVAVPSRQSVNGKNLVEKSYYLTGDESKKGQKFKVALDTTSTKEEDKYLELTIKTDLANSADGSSFTYDKAGKVTDLTAGNASVSSGAAKVFYVKDGDKTKESLATSTDVADSIKTLLNANKDEAVKYEDENKKAVPAQSTKDIVSELLKGTGLGINKLELDSTGKTVSSLELKTDAEVSSALTTSLGKVSVTVAGATSGNFAADIASADLTANTEDALKDFLAKDANVTKDKITIGTFPTMPITSGEIKINATYTQASNKLVLKVTVGEVAQATASDISATVS